MLVFRKSLVDAYIICARRRRQPRGVSAPPGAPRSGPRAAAAAARLVFDLRGVGRPQHKDDLLEECLERAGLWAEVKDRLNTHGGALSGGQQQRLCIARALAVRPQVLLMDEPCSALDPGSTLRIEETISQLSSSVTIVIVTHNMQQAARVSDYTAFFLSDGGPGQMIEVGSTNDIFSRPKDERTENYVTGRFG